MKKFQILIIIFIILTLSGQAVGCACGYFTDKSGLDGSNIDNTGDSQKDTADSQNNTDNTGKDTVSTQTPQKYAIIASGASYDSQHCVWFLNSTSMAYKLLKNNGFADENIYYLFKSAKESNVDYQATIGNFKKVIEELRQKAGKTVQRLSNLFWLLLMGLEMQTQT